MLVDCACILVLPSRARLLGKHRPRRLSRGGALCSSCMCACMRVCRGGGGGLRCQRMREASLSPGGFPTQQCDVLPAPLRTGARLGGEILSVAPHRCPQSQWTLGRPWGALLPSAAGPTVLTGTSSEISLLLARVSSAHTFLLPCCLSWLHRVTTSPWSPSDHHVQLCRCSFLPWYPHPRFLFILIGGPSSFSKVWFYLFHFVSGYLSSVNSSFSISFLFSLFSPQG